MLMLGCMNILLSFLLGFNGFYVFCIDIFLYGYIVFCEYNWIIFMNELLISIEFNNLYFNSNLIMKRWKYMIYLLLLDWLFEFIDGIWVEFCGWWYIWKYWGGCLRMGILGIFWGLGRIF